MARTKKAAIDLAASVPEVAGPSRYRALTSQEIAVENGVKVVQPGDIVVAEGDDVNVYPVERFVEAYPDVSLDDIDDQE